MIPRPLLALLGAVAIAAVAWALLVPPFMAPDESEHFTYAQSLAENGERPPVGRLEDPELSSEARGARALAMTRVVVAERQYRPAWDRLSEQIWDIHKDELDRADIVAAGPQANHPPGYYAYEVAPYAAASSGDLFDRLFLMRLWSGLLLLVTTAGAWLLIGELTGRDRLLQLVGSACVGLQPMATFLSATVNPDSLLFASFAVGLWLAARVLRRGPGRVAVGGLILATAMAILAKPAGLALVPALLIALALSAWRHGRNRALIWGGAVLASAVLLALGVSTERGIGERAPIELEPGILRGFATYLWDFYLPRLPFQHEYAALSIDSPVWTVWVKHTWASFGLLEVQFPAGAYVPLALVAVGSFVAAGLALRHRRFEIDPGVVGMFAAVSVALVVGVHWVDFQSVHGEEHRAIQGRYFLPLMPIAGVAVAAALTNLGRRRELAAALVLGGLAVLQLFSLGAVAGRYFA